MHTLTLGGLALAAAVVTLLVSRMTRGITIYGADTLEQVRAADRSGEWRWLSDMHKGGSGRTRMKDAFVLGLAAMQRLLGDRTSGHPPVVLCLVANAVSAILIFLIASAYWTPAVGLLVAALFLTSFWPYLNALYGGPICLAQTCFLASAYLMERAAVVGPWQAWAWYEAAGVAFGLMLFSSASSRKYLPLLAGAFVYSQRTALSPLWEDQQELWSRAGLALAVLLALGLAFVWLRRRRMVRALVMWAGFYILGCVALSRSTPFYTAQLALAAGAVIPVLLFTWPDVRRNLRSFFDLWTSGHKWGNHFPVYRKYFERMGRPIREGMRGAGLRWIARYFWHIAPFHSAYFLFCFALPIGLLVLEGFHAEEAVGTLGVLALSLSPVIVGEVTRGPQLGRTYFPAFAGLLLLMGYAAFRADQALIGFTAWAFWGLPLACLATSAAWNLWVFVDDVWPTRMAPVWLTDTLKALEVKELYAYDTPYNFALFYIMWQELLQKYNVRFIRTLREAREGYVVVPGTSHKAVSMECHPYAMEHGDFDEDPLLNPLLDSKAITRYVVASFKTLGSSRMWGHEGEVTSYRDLILKEIGEHDRWRARAWILDAGKLWADGLCRIGEEKSQENFAQN